MQHFNQNIINLYGDKGKNWLHSLPKLIQEYAKDWHLTQLKPFENLTYNYVLSAVQNTKPVVLKVSPDIESLRKEADALRAFNGHSCVKFYAENDDALLIERAIPGQSLKNYFNLRDEEAIYIASDLITKLHKAPLPIENQFPHISDWLALLDQDLNIPSEYLQKARDLKNHLLETSPKNVLLHGDLHHDNILSHSNDWIAIDPKGIIGDPAYEIAAFIRNPIPDLLTIRNAKEIIEKRIQVFAHILKTPSQRIAQWNFVQAILAWAWALEDDCDPLYFKKFTEICNIY
ncbi:MAG: aminoglycoside phosphotransferase family protein [Alphaproteobacteria bacterium]|nr:aminoglycoside phosphotransferase family protein [Alphaproteobacteria bacterium]